MKRRKISKLLLLGSAGLLASPVLYIASKAGKKAYHYFSDPGLEILDENRSLIEELAEVIIPETDVPGARQAGVGEFIITMIKDCTNKQSQHNFIEGLIDLMEYAEDKFTKTFIACTAEEKISILKHFEQIGEPYKGIIGKAERKIMGDSFFITLKKTTVLGYCTSEIGATKSLSFDYIPGKYIGIVALTDGQKAWATQ